MPKKVILIVILILCISMIGYGIYIKNNQNKENNVNMTSNINVYDYYDEEETIKKEETEDSKTIYLWNKDNIPTTTNYTKNNGNYFDDPDFVPYMTKYDVPEGVKEL